MNVVNTHIVPDKRLFSVFCDSTSNRVFAPCVGERDLPLALPSLPLRYRSKWLCEDTPGEIQFGSYVRSLPPAIEHCKIEHESMMFKKDDSTRKKFEQMLAKTIECLR